MPFVLDNTIKSNLDIVGAINIGDSYLVPPAGAGGSWENLENAIVTWGGSVWSPSYPATAVEYEIQRGPNAGRIYVRTPVADPLVNLIANSDLDIEVPSASAPTWSRILVAGGTAVWNAAGFIDLESTTTGDAAGAKVTFTTVSGTKYRAVIVLGSYTTVPPDSVVEYVLRNETAATESVVEIIDTTTEVIFLAGSASYSLHVRVKSTGATAGSASLTRVQVFRVAELVTDGAFDDDLVEWTVPTNVAPVPAPLWVADAAVALPFAGTMAASTIDFTGHTQFPALRQTITGLVPGTYYRVAFDADANFARGLISVALDGTVLRDYETAGGHEVYFLASAATQDLEFPLTKKSGMTPFSIKLDNVSLQAALWMPPPVGQANIAGIGEVNAGVAIGRAVRIGIAGLAGFSCSATIQKPATGHIDGRSGIEAPAVFRTSIRNAPTAINGSSSLRFSTGAQRNVGGVVAAKSGMRITPDNPYYTVDMAIDAITELLSASSCSCASDGCGPLQKEALGCLNAAMQRLSASGRDWGFVSNVALTLGPNVDQTGEIDLPPNVVSVRRAVFRPALDEEESAFASFPLRPLTSRHEVEAYRLASGRDLWPLTGAESAISAYNLPIGYFTEGEDLQNGQPNGPPQLRLLFAPIYNSALPWKVDVQAHIQPPRLTCMNLMDGTRLPVPHRFAETLLVPLAKYYAMSLRWFRRPDLAESIQNQAKDALMLTGEFQPANPQAGKETKGASAK